MTAMTTSRTAPLEVVVAGKSKRPVIRLGPITIRAMAGQPGAWRWRAEWYPPGEAGRMQTRSLARKRGERFNQDEAIARAAELLSDGVHLKPTDRPGGTRTVTTVRDLLEAWLGFQRSRVGASIRESTWRNYRHHAARISKEPIADIRLEHLTETHLVHLLRGLRARLADQTVAIVMTTMSAACKWATAQSALPPLTMPRWEVERPMQHMPSVSDVSATVRSLKAMGPDRLRCSKREQTILAIELLFQTGARPGEAAQTRFAHLDPKRGIWRIFPGEGVKTGGRDVPIQPALMSRLLSAPENPEGLVFPPLRTPTIAAKSWNAWIRRGAGAAEVPKWTCKGLRHLAVTRMLTSGIDVKTASSITGHSPTVLLRTYAHALDDARQRASKVLAASLGGADVIPFPKRESS